MGEFLSNIGKSLGWWAAGVALRIVIKCRVKKSRNCGFTLTEDAAFNASYLDPLALDDAAKIIGDDTLRVLYDWCVEEKFSDRRALSQLDANLSTLQRTARDEVMEAHPQYLARLKEFVKKYFPKGI